MWGNSVELLYSKLWTSNPESSNWQFWDSTLDSASVPYSKTVISNELYTFSRNFKIRYSRLFANVPQALTWQRIKEHHQTTLNRWQQFSLTNLIKLKDSRNSLPLTWHEELLTEPIITFSGVQEAQLSFLKIFSLSTFMSLFLKTLNFIRLVFSLHHKIYPDQLRYIPSIE